MTLQSFDNKIHTIRNSRVKLDFDLTKLYQVETRALKQSIKRNMDRFFDDFTFQLTKQEWLEVQQGRLPEDNNNRNAIGYKL